MQNSAKMRFALRRVPHVPLCTLQLLYPIISLFANFPLKKFQNVRKESPGPLRPRYPTSGRSGCERVEVASLVGEKSANAAAQRRRSAPIAASLDSVDLFMGRIEGVLHTQTG
ncbi:MAG: hypothetical protein A2Y14_01520 [Verrucomicrobia bacterium GWF2_51_19]|nr:MAG: hypothetical protein A2Y14_01520 [Verrucomicrobia bacterium GWF2_51_19]